jgi:hypothetical protein
VTPGSEPRWARAVTCAEIPPPETEENFSTLRQWTFARRDGILLSEKT